ncbi:MASE1 domain-containing protein [Vibrio sp. TH_r3]|uniref:MASE1 domain-containing sensor histidine kinase n=1 Tax=Vibrio sp. TH_r3 TaxID=3082084 RepID=UPI0029535D93|nr:MASE1 domain-containing protein [Vibrio sp. TH_r3]MDV7103859.1 MASE1 domain-containing protein [Vibrio sp. TH_r3]
MKTVKEQISSRAFTSLFIYVIYSITWFCLWSISGYLVSNIYISGLFLPIGLRLAVLLIMPIKHWWVVFLSEFVLTCVIVQTLQPSQTDLLLFIAPFISYSVIRPIQRWWQYLDTYWQQLLALLGVIVVNSFLYGCVIFFLSKPLLLDLSLIYSAMIATLTGGIILAPFFYLLHDYLNQKVWVPLSPTLVHNEVTLRPSAFLWMLLFFCIGLLAELSFKQQMASLLLIVVLLPNIFMAYRYGWQGGILAAVMNSVLLTMAKKVMGSFSTYEEMQLFLTTQALVGLGLGIAISRQYLLSETLKKLNYELAHELSVKQALTRQLVHVEEDIRKSVARELHDEIGQNITAIQIQATLANRTTQESNTKQIATAINDLAFRVHSATRQLLSQLRPHVLDQLGLEGALKQIANEMRFSERNVTFNLNIGFDTEQLDDVTSVTVYRIVQELINNATKHSHATEITLTFLPGTLFSMEYRDNGIGLPVNWQTKGTGLKGLSERITALGGSLSISNGSANTTSQQIRNDKLPNNSKPDNTDKFTPMGIRIVVSLPTKASRSLSAKTDQSASSPDATIGSDIRENR